MEKSSNNVIINNIENTEDTEETYLKTTDLEVSSYQSPTLMIQRETNELMLLKKHIGLNKELKPNGVDFFATENKHNTSKLTMLIMQITLKNG